MSNYPVIKPTVQKIYSFVCPICGAYIESPDTGSVDFYEEEMSNHIEKHGRIITCQHCKFVFQISKSVK